MGQFAEPEVLATFDRTWGEKKEELRLERGEYQGNPTYSLRLYWQTPDGAWRWAAQKPTQSGKCWERMNLKGRELEKLGEALLRASKNVVDTPPARREPPARRAPGERDDDDIPF